MNDGSSRTFAELPAMLKRNGSYSKTFQEYIPQTTDKLLQESVQQWPTTVSADGSGTLSERLTSEHRIRENDGFALLPTPTARDYKDAGPNVNYKRIAEHRVLPGVVMHELYNNGKKS